MQILDMLMTQHCEQRVRWNNADESSGCVDHGYRRNTAAYRKRCDAFLIHVKSRMRHVPLHCFVYRRLGSERCQLSRGQQADDPTLEICDHNTICILELTPAQAGEHIAACGLGPRRGHVAHEPMCRGFADKGTHGSLIHLGVLRCRFQTGAMGVAGACGFGAGCGETAVPSRRLVVPTCIRRDGKELDHVAIRIGKLE